jgi:DNA replication and repair protein RecF
MYVSSLTLRDFRNIPTLELALQPGSTLLHGPNASGKTSLLEAFFFLATTRSPRISSDRELVRWQAQGEAGVLPFARLVAEVQRNAGTLTLEVIVQLREHPHAPNATATSYALPHTVATKKLVRLNRRPVRAIDLVGNLRVVLFTPSDLVLVEGAPADRRRYLDTTLSQLDPRYVRTLSHYNRLVQQRNTLLRAWREQRRPQRAVDKELGYWDGELATSGGYILAERMRAMSDLNQIAAPIFQQIAGGEQKLTIAYQTTVALDTTAPSPQEYAAQIQQHLQHLRRDEVKRGQTLIGPHRDDLLFSVGGVDLGVYGSRGQQRSVALALKLGEAAFMQQRSGEMPVLLLDDVLSELDMQRRKHVLEVINRPEQQTLLTATDLGGFEASFLQRIRCLRVEEGQVYAG